MPPRRAPVAQDIVSSAYTCAFGAALSLDRSVREQRQRTRNTWFAAKYFVWRALAAARMSLFGAFCVRSVTSLRGGVGREPEQGYIVSNRDWS